MVTEHGRTIVNSYTGMGCGSVASSSLVERLLVAASPKTPPSSFEF